MRTTLDIPEDVLRDVQETTGAPTRREAVVIALADYLRRQRLRRIIDAAGTLDFDGLEVRAIRALEMRRVGE